MSAEEATVNPDGSTTFEQEPPATEDAGGADAGGAGGDETPNMDEETFEKAEEIAQGVDPAVYLLLAVIFFGALYYFFVYRKKSDDSEAFFSELDGDKVSQPSAVISENRWVFDACMQGLFPFSSHISYVLRLSIVQSQTTR